MLHVKRATIKQQLEQPEFQSIQQILVGELKATNKKMKQTTVYKRKITHMKQMNN